MSDPLNSFDSIGLAIKYWEGLDFMKPVYPDARTKAIISVLKMRKSKRSKVKAPKTVFIPCKKMMRKMSKVIQLG